MPTKKHKDCQAVRLMARGSLIWGNKVEKVREHRPIHRSTSLTVQVSPKRGEIGDFPVVLIFNIGQFVPGNSIYQYTGPGIPLAHDSITSRCTCELRA